MTVYVTNGELSDSETQAYVEYCQQKYSDRTIDKLTITVDNDYVNLECEFVPDRPFERIRRITGYLVGTLDRFNDGKRAEEHDRVKHSTEE